MIGKPKPLTFSIPKWRRAKRCEICQTKNTWLFFLDEPVTDLIRDL